MYKGWALGGCCHRASGLLLVGRNCCDSKGKALSTGLGLSHAGSVLGGCISPAPLGMLGWEMQEAGCRCPTSVGGRESTSAMQNLGQMVMGDEVQRSKSLEQESSVGL